MVGLRLNGTAINDAGLKDVARLRQLQELDLSETGVHDWGLKHLAGLKQLQVLQLMADGNSNKQISQIVGISEATVKYHTSQLFKLLSVKNRTSCVREAQNCGLLTAYDEA